MPTYRVAKTGNDSTGDGSAASPYLTIAKALNISSAQGSDGNTVEIIDEGTYNEGSLIIDNDNLTLKHTASWLGRPVISADGISENDSMQAFIVGGAGTTYIGLEISGFGHNGPNGQGVFKNGGPWGSLNYHKFHMSGCFVHDCSTLGGTSFKNTDADNPSTLKQCIMFFVPHNKDFNCLNNDATGYMEISNCLITSSYTLARVVNDYGTKLTASFSTFINRTNLYNRFNAQHRSEEAIIRAGKVINCIISGSGNGIASDDHAYNLVMVETTDASTGIPYLELDETLGTTGSGDITYEDPEFLNGGSVGNEESIASDYRLQETSPAIDAGRTYDSIAVDLTGTLRPQGATNSFDMGCYEYISISPEWTTYEEQENLNLSSDFTINNYINLQVNQKYRIAHNPEQVPFSRGVKGPATLRGRNTPYKVDK